jgi:hypothetical protein
MAYVKNENTTGRIGVFVPARRYRDGSQVVYPGDGVTWSVGSDRYTGTVVRIATNGKTVDVVEDHAELLNPDEAARGGGQIYKYTPGNPKNVLTFTLRKRSDGEWFKLRGTSSQDSTRWYLILSAGRRRYYDYDH